jgi:cell division protein FtsQ
MARKSGSTILQEELYPPSVSVRADVEDSRLVDLRSDDLSSDLDAEEQSPFLRGQKRVSARRSTLPKKTANRLLWAVVAAFALCVAGVCAAFLYHYGEHSWRFRVESSDNIEITGMQNATKAQIMEVMGADIGRNIFFIPLAQQKAQLEQIPWVESASVMRFVPNHLRVEVHERTPVAFARIGPRMFLIDAGGTLMELSPKHKYSFPVILGMNPGEPLSTRAPRMKAYLEMVRELDSDGSRYSQDLSETDLTDLEDVKVRVNDPAGDVQVHLGASDYLRRYRIFVTHAQAWRQQFQKLESVDLRYDNQIIVNPDIVNADAKRASKPTPLSPASAKAAAAAGVKPAALLTRVGADGRQVPKPAFELTQKKLESSTSNAVKKPAPKVKAVKASAPLVKVADAGQKKSPASEKPAAKNLKKPMAKSSAPPRPASAKKPPSKSAKANTKLQAHATGGQKPSPAIAKSQANQTPSD